MIVDLVHCKISRNNHNA